MDTRNDSTEFYNKEREETDDFIYTFFTSFGVTKMTREDENDLYYGKSYLTNIANLKIARNFLS